MDGNNTPGHDHCSNSGSSAFGGQAERTWMRLLSEISIPCDRCVSPFEHPALAYR
ncbi:hypothetical protein HYDPIDRAFT_116988 [Hydnomerulius pinastri MD-312]|uniref:Unplaced genomic scaffold scaffold_37, whole genome shotgun sequence n=1 Tax=Hydnomerulius pinastri MD-312 TaxID=994086 RepID=A0A0C9UZQ2_9AGAM|nr:hypothetical protein HYDPIDRAFT_119477 [Hydnomerulius pinastri MD-312]KIJ60499.1 hypothetical protein HYDPIDRAFT_116988 [Hydnomerulius pinastri MD-312]